MTEPRNFGFQFKPEWDLDEISRNELNLDHYDFISNEYSPSKRLNVICIGKKRINGMSFYVYEVGRDVWAISRNLAWSYKGELINLEQFLAFIAA